MVIVKRRLPKNFKDEDLEGFSRELEKTFDGYKIISIKNKFVSSRGLIIPSIVQTFFWIKNFKHNLSHHLRHKKVKLKNNQKYLIAFDHWSPGYFHWFTDTLTRIIVLEEELEELNIILPSACHQEFHRSSLVALNCYNITFINPNEMLFFSRAKFVSLTAPSGNYNPKIIQKLALRLNEYFENKNLKFDIGEKIFISRKKASKRRLSNEKFLYQILKKYNFKIICFEDYSLENQWSICHNAKYLVGLHGAGLTNMLFLPNQAKVLELRKSGDTHNLCYFSLANALQIDYYYLFAEPVNKKEDFHTADLYVDPKEFEDVLALMIAE